MCGRPSTVTLSLDSDMMRSKRRLKQRMHTTGLDTGCVYGGALSGSVLVLPARTGHPQRPAPAVRRPPGERD